MVGFLWEAVADSTIASHVDGQRSVGRDGAGCVGKWPMDAGHGTNAKFPKKFYPEEAKARYRDKNPNWFPNPVAAR